jgi:hypothetical protein
VIRGMSQNMYFVSQAGFVIRSARERELHLGNSVIDLPDRGKSVLMRMCVLFGAFSDKFQNTCASISRFAIVITN